MNTSMLEAPARRRRRRHSADFKASVVRECLRPGVSIASVALANGLNATMLRKWVVEAERGERPVKLPPPASTPRTEAASGTPGFIALQLAPPPLATPADIRIELQRADTTIKVTWPADAAAECAAWLRELLR